MALKYPIFETIKRWVGEKKFVLEIIISLCNCTMSDPVFLSTSALNSILGMLDGTREVFSMAII